MSRVINGNCLCGKVKFTTNDAFMRFYQCHCEQCRKLTGSAFASNLFTVINNIDWVCGSEYTVRYEHPDRDFAKAFCRECGSALPYVNKVGSALVIPAGSLNYEPSIKPTANIFMGDKVLWPEKFTLAKQFEGFPE